MNILVGEVGGFPVKFPQSFEVGHHEFGPGVLTSFQRSTLQITNSRAIKVHVFRCFSIARAISDDRFLLRFSFGMLASATASLSGSMSPTCPLDILDTAEHAFRLP